MSKISIEGNASGTGTLTIAAPNTNSNYTLTLPESTGTMVVTGGAQTIEFAAGTVSAPSITTTGDTNTGIFFPAADTIAFAEGGAEAMRIDSSGNVGIGTSSPSTFGKFAVQTSTSSNTPVVAIVDNSLSPQLNHYITDSGSTVRNLNQIAFNTGSSSSANYQGFMTFSTMASAGGTISERMRIDASGNLLVGLTSGNGSGKVITQQNGNSNDNSYSGLDIYKGSSTTTTAQVFQRFFTSNGAGGSGSITANGVSAATFTAYSDRRLKENIQDLSPQLENICNLKPVEFDYIGYPEGQGHQIGFVAQDMQEVYPDVVAAGENDMLQIAGWSKTEARLVKAIQELKAELDEAKARIATLEAGA